MIGYTGPIRCLRLYRTVILPPRGILIFASLSILFPRLLRVTYAGRFAAANLKNYRDIFDESLARVNGNVFGFGVNEKS